MTAHAGHEHARQPAQEGHEHADGSRDHGPAAHDQDHGHDHEHGHDHGSSVLARVRHAVSQVFGAHSHDSADQVDETLEADSDGRRALLLSLLILAVTAAIQAAVVVLSGSVALLGDTLHNVADALTAVPLLIAFRLARRPATKRYTYGYGRAEDLGGLFVVAIITLSSVLAAWEAIDRLIHPRHVTHLWVVAIAAVVGFAGNEIVARYRLRVGRRIGSAALVADGLHARTDGFTSLAVLLGAGGLALGWRAADPVIGLVITVARRAPIGDPPGRRPAHGRRGPGPGRPGHRRRRQRRRRAGRPRAAHPLDRPHPARRGRRHRRPRPDRDPGPRHRPPRRDPPARPGPPPDRRHHPYQPDRHPPVSGALIRRAARATDITPGYRASCPVMR